MDLRLGFVKLKKESQEREPALALLINRRHHRRHSW